MYELPEPAGHHDGDEQHADFPRDQNADHVDDIVFGAELAEMEEALLRDDAADEEGNQDDDRRGLPADPVELVDRRSEAEMLGMPDDPERGRADGAKHVHEWEYAARRFSNAVGISLECGGQPPAPGFSRLFPVGVPDVAQEPLVLFTQANDTRMEARARSFADQALQEPGAISVERLDAVHVDGNVAHARRLLHGLPDHSFKAGRVNGRPRTRGRKLVSVPLQT